MTTRSFPIVLICLLAACGSGDDPSQSSISSVVDISSETACASYLTGKVFSNDHTRIEFPIADQVVISDARTGNVTTRCVVAYGTWAELNEEVGGLARLIEMDGCSASRLKKILLRDEGDLFDNETLTSYAYVGSSTAKADTQSSAHDSNVLDAGSRMACENYLKGKTFSGGSAQLKFNYDGTVSVFDQGGNLILAGTLEVGEAKSAVSRWIYVRNISGSGKLQFLLSNDGKMMEPGSLAIYRPE